MSHMKRISMPKSWVSDNKKNFTWIIRPKPGAHSFDQGISLSVILRDMLHYAENTREAKDIVLHKTVLVDGKRRKDHKFLVGLMDVVSFPDTKESFRVLLDKKEKISLLKIDDKESKIKPCKITGKSKVGKKTQLNLFDGKNILVDKDSYKVGETVVIEMPEQKIKEQFKLEKGAVVYLTGGKMIGQTATVDGIKENTISVKTKEGSFDTPKKYCFVMGKEKSIIKIEK